MTTLPEWAKWLARDKNGKLNAFEYQPTKYTDTNRWASEGHFKTVMETDDTFEDILWTDDEPVKVADYGEHLLERAESLKEMCDALNRNWEVEHGKPSVEEYNQWQITQAKAHGYDEPPIMSDYDMVAKPKHYIGVHGIETIDVIRNFGNDDMIAGFYWGNAIKYMTRYRSKNGLEDLKKARKNLDWLIEHVEAIE